MKQKQLVIFSGILAIIMLFSGIFLLTGFNPLTIFESDNISVTKLHSMLDGNYQFVDIRTASEYNAEHIDEFTINLDFYQFENNLSMLNVLDKEKPTIIICNSGNRSNIAYSLMKDYGFKQVYNVLGGIQAWWNKYE